MADPFRGKTVRWTYVDGPTAGKEFEHAFGRGGKATYSMDGSPAGERVDYSVARISPRVHLVCYLAPSGWTLSTVLDSRTGAIVSVASSKDEVFVQHGHLLKAKAPAKKPRRVVSRKAPRKASAARSSASRPTKRAASGPLRSLARSTGVAEARSRLEK